VNVYRLVNDAIARLESNYRRAPDARFRIFCECGEPSCSDRFEIERAGFERARDNEAAWIVCQGRSKGDPFLPVEK